jgi:hypothetical protein
MSGRLPIATRKRTLSPSCEESNRLAPMQQWGESNRGNSALMSPAVRTPSLHTAKAKVDLASLSKAKRADELPAPIAAASASTPTVDASSTVVIGLRVLPAFLTRAECETLISYSRLYVFSPSRVGHNGVYEYDGSIRTSCSAALPVSYPLVAAVRAKIAAAVGATSAHIENGGLSLLRYDVGQRFNTHFDSSAAQARPRRASIIIYLNDAELDGGGETRFPHLDVEFTPTCGTAVTWLNMSSRKSVYESSEHQSLPVKRGVKYAINMFILFDPK